MSLDLNREVWVTGQNVRILVMLWLYRICIGTTSRRCVVGCSEWSGEMKESGIAKKIVRGLG